MPSIRPPGRRSFARHLDHRPPESCAGEQALGGLIPRRRGEHDSGRATSLEPCQRGIEQHAAHALPATGGINHNIVEHARWPAQRHVVSPFERCIGIAEHFPFAMRDEDGYSRILELRPEVGGIPLFGPRGGRDETRRIELVVGADQERAQPPQRREIRRRCRPYGDPGPAQRHPVLPSFRFCTFLLSIVDNVPGESLIES
jgi:hypothetical protein